MKKISIALISVITLSVLGIGGWFTYTKYELRKAELEYMEYSQKPSGMISFWSKAEIPISLKLTMGDGQIRWVPLSSGGGFAGSFDAGNIRIERIYEEEVLASFELALDNDAEADFNVYENSFEPRY
jgi:hypothetical protein